MTRYISDPNIRFGLNDGRDCPFDHGTCFACWGPECKDMKQWEAQIGIGAVEYDSWGFQQSAANGSTEKP